jgi:hypothetical protein
VCDYIKDETPQWCSNSEDCPGYNSPCDYDPGADCVEHFWSPDGCGVITCTARMPPFWPYLKSLILPVMLCNAAGLILVITVLAIVRCVRRACPFCRRAAGSSFTAVPSCFPLEVNYSFQITRPTAAPTIEPAATEPTTTPSP